MTFRLRLLAALSSLALIAAATGFTVLLSGTVNVAASSGHSRLVEWVLSIAMKRSVERHARDIVAPPLGSPALVSLGMRFFETDCVPCHGAPGVPRADANDQLVPVPPELSTLSGEWRPRELFWIVRHGIKSTGMPAWGRTHRDDEIWAAVAFMQALAGRTPEEYRAMTRVEGAAPEAEAIGSGRLVALAGPAVQHSAACARCHGLDGAGDATGAFPSLAGQNLDYMRDALRRYASGERPSGIMTSIVHRLTDRERDAVAAYYAGLARPARESAGARRDPAYAQGQALVETGAPAQNIPPCADCHGREGSSVKPKVPDLGGQHAEFLALQLRLWRSGERGADGAAAPMAAIARRLTEAQASAAALYFASQ